MTRFMTSGKIGSIRQDYFVHVGMMLGRRLTKAEVKRIDRERRDGLGFVVIAEGIALETGEALNYPKAYPEEKRRIR